MRTENIDAREVARACVARYLSQSGMHLSEKERENMIDHMEQELIDYGHSIRTVKS